MEIKRVGENKIRCALTEDEIRKMGFDIDEIIGNGEATQKFMRVVLKIVEEMCIRDRSQSYSENAGQTSGTGTSGQITQASGTGAAGNTGGGGDSDDETTTTKTVVINGVTYLETTTVENGVKSVQRTAISGVGAVSYTHLVRCIAASLRDYHNEVKYAFSISGPTSRMTRERVEELSVDVRKVVLFSLPIQMRS